MLLKASADDYDVPVVETRYGNTVQNNAFKAGLGSNVASEEGDYKNYILNSGTFYLANNKMVATNKAYLQLKKVDNSQQPAKLIFPEGDATAISNATMGENVNGTYYNLQGVKVQNPTRGLYILNGKKYVVK